MAPARASRKTRPVTTSRVCALVATLRSMAINALRLEGIWSITEGIAALAHDIKGLLTLLGWRAMAQAPSG